MGDWFSQLETKFTTSPMAAILRAADRDNGWRYLDLVSVARDCNQEGRLVSTNAGQETPWAAESLCHRVQCSPAEYQTFIDLCVAKGWLTRDGDVYSLPNPRSWWGPKTDAERQADKRKREKGSCEAPEESTLCQHSDDEVSHIAAELTSTGHCVTGVSRDVTEPSRDCHGVSRDVTHSQLQTDQQTDQQSQTISTKRSGRTWSGPSGSFEMDKSIGSGNGKSAEAFGEKQFMTMVVDLHARYIGPDWGTVSLRKLKAVLKRPWAIMHQDWSVRIAAIRFGLMHMDDDRDALEDGTRAIPINDPWAYALGMAPKYAPICAEHVSRNRKRVANGEKALPVAWERVEWSTPEKVMACR